MTVGGIFGGKNMEECRSCPNVATSQRRDVRPIRESSPFDIQVAISFGVFKEECPNDRGFALWRV